MRRLLQLAFLLLTAASLFTLPAEFFDRWDPAGLPNDTEFAVFLLAFFLCLVLVVAMLVALQTMKQQFASRLDPLRIASFFDRFTPAPTAPVPLHSSPPPLRI